MLGRVVRLGAAPLHLEPELGDPAKTDWNAAQGRALEFTTAEWYEMLKEADRMETLITEPLGRDGRVRPRSTASSWSSTNGAPGTRPAPRSHPTHLLGQQNTHARRAGRRPDARHVPPPRRQGRDGQHRAARELPAVAVPRRRRQVHHHADLPRVRSLRRRTSAARRCGRWSRRRRSPTSAPKDTGSVVGPQRVGQREGQDAHAHGHQPARQRAAGGRDRRCAARRRARSRARRSARRTSTPTTRSPSRTRSGSRTATVGRGAERRARAPLPAGVGDAASVRAHLIVWAA